MNDTDVQVAMARAESARRTGEVDAAVDLLQHTISTLADTRPQSSHALGDACNLLADILAGANRMPQAIQAYQEAADAYARDPACAEHQKACAERVVEGVHNLRQHPEDRLLLLIAQYDRELRQLADTPGTEDQQADIAFRIATVLQRRGRFADAAARYHEALALYTAAAGSELSTAACHQRLGGLYHHELSDAAIAADHYRRAIRIYADHEGRHEGEQVNRVLCEELLAGLLAAGR